jgi:NAD(P)-dependent dehydrogenase (short-subunit alcohol dehydrogenase family)
MTAAPVPIIDLTGRVVVVTGGNSGIGLGIGRGVARAGGSVAVWSRREDRNEAAVKELEALGAQAAAFACDVTSEDRVTSAMEATLDRFGRLDVLVANAGISSRQPFVEMPLEEWRHVLQVNLDGAFLCLREAARVLVRQGEGGALVGVSSTSSVHGAPGQEHYSASKTAMQGLMRSLAVELARHRVRCNTLVPGWTETELTEPARQFEKFLTNTTQRTPVRRWATLEDFEAVGAFLADPTITFHTGDSIVVDGGYTVF